MPMSVVLVHGGWHGGWCWSQVARLLRTAGHDVHVPTLTGLGERAHLVHRDVDLELHVRDVMATLTYEDVHDALLVGHSYGGMVIAGVADRVPERVAHAVYLDAFVPSGGQSLLELVLPGRRDMFLQTAREQGEGWLVPAPTAESFGVTDAKEAARVDALLTPQPLRTFQQPLPLRSPAGTDVSCTYVHCTTGPRAEAFAPFARHAAEHGWRTLELPTGHDAMLTMPDGLAAVLSEL
jgi:pimeloyl-ACP methyl ester carboxylesterase